MERGFYNEDFDLEDLLKQKSDQLKMYPSDKVWKGIHSNLHSTRRWYWLSLVLFLTGVSYYAADQLIATERARAGLDRYLARFASIHATSPGGHAT